MDNEFLPAAVVWAALGVGLACLVLRMIPGRPPAEDPDTPSEAPGAPGATGTPD